jgi:hypothetical protein
LFLNVTVENLAQPTRADPNVDDIDARCTLFDNTPDEPMEVVAVLAAGAPTGKQKDTSGSAEFWPAALPLRPNQSSKYLFPLGNNYPPFTVAECALIPNAKGTWYSEVPLRYLR